MFSAIYNQEVYRFVVKNVAVFVVDTTLTRQWPSNQFRSEFTRIPSSLFPCHLFPCHLVASKNFARWPDSPSGTDNLFHQARMYLSHMQVARTSEAYDSGYGCPLPNAALAAAGLACWLGSNAGA